jgi:hypothetical protein
MTHVAEVKQYLNNLESASLSKVGNILHNYSDESVSLLSVKKIICVSYFIMMAVFDIMRATEIACRMGPQNLAVY